MGQTFYGFKDNKGLSVSVKKISDNPEGFHRYMRWGAANRPGQRDHFSVQQMKKELI